MDLLYLTLLCSLRSSELIPHFQPMVSLVRQSLESVQRFNFIFNYKVSIILTDSDPIAIAAAFIGSVRAGTVVAHLDDMAKE